MSAQPLLVILGPTASGKTKLAVKVAQQLDGEIISADSRQIFKGMSIGTGKDLNEYNIGAITIPYHLIDIRAAGDRYHVNNFKEDFYQAFDEILLKKKLPILCGGTGMYIHSLLQNHELTAIPVNLAIRDKLQSVDREELINILKTYPSELIDHADLTSNKRLIRAIEVAAYLCNNELHLKKRTEFKPLVIGLHTSVETRRSRILSRLNKRLEEGLIEEVVTLINQGVSKDALIFYGLEYKFVISYLDGEINFETLKNRLGTAICQFAKRQMTFFRKMEKDGVQINWLNAEGEFGVLSEKAISLVKGNL